MSTVASSGLMKDFLDIKVSGCIMWGEVKRMKPGFYYAVARDSNGPVRGPIGVKVVNTDGSCIEDRCDNTPDRIAVLYFDANEWDKFGFWDRLFSHIKHN